ncbi:hypothetical protein DXG01_013067 [Tephrocybe rancida]|nr:hypothetical protein DXG01_013067 [Tephrocybe rancida]
MKFISLFIFAAAAVTSTLAAPAELEKRGLSAYVCEGTNFTGRCVNYIPPWNTCEPFSALGLNGFQSWGPGQGKSTRISREREREPKY